MRQQLSSVHGDGNTHCCKPPSVFTVTLLLGVNPHSCPACAFHHSLGVIQVRDTLPKGASMNFKTVDVVTTKQIIKLDCAFPAVLIMSGLSVQVKESLVTDFL